MDTIFAAKEILKELGLPDAQQNEMSALTLLALAGIGPRNNWKNTTNRSLTVTKGIMVFVKSKYGREYAPNTRETFRRYVLHQFIQAGVVELNPDNPDLPTNSPQTHYRLSLELATILKEYNTSNWHEALKRFIASHPPLRERYRKYRAPANLPVELPGNITVKLSAGKHNRLQVQVLEEFIPRFVADAEVVYLGDTASKALYINEKVVERLKVLLSEHEKLPDIMVYDNAKEEVVPDRGCHLAWLNDPKTVEELSAVFRDCTAQLIYVTAFASIQVYKHFLDKIAWETEVWISEIPDHLIHYNGDLYIDHHAA